LRKFRWVKIDGVPKAFCIAGLPCSNSPWRQRLVLLLDADFAIFRTICARGLGWYACHHRAQQWRQAGRRVGCTISRCIMVRRPVLIAGSALAAIRSRCAKLQARRDSLLRLEEQWNDVPAPARNPWKARPNKQRRAKKETRAQ
jgi:hypothetical protein